jgi:hypothetical protein
MKLNRIVAFLLACLALALSYVIYLDYIYMLGFPDGSITELGYAERRLARVFIWVSVISASCLIYLGGVASRKKVGKKLSVVIILYLVSIISIYLIDNYYRLHLMDGTGG